MKFDFNMKHPAFPFCILTFFHAIIILHHYSVALWQYLYKCPENIHSIRLQYTLLCVSTHEVWRGLLCFERSLSDVPVPSVTEGKNQQAKQVLRHCGMAEKTGWFVIFLSHPCKKHVVFFQLFLNLKDTHTTSLMTTIRLAIMI